MATYAKTTFDVAQYLSSRPTYPAQLYKIIVAFHKAKGGRMDHAVDLGCGPGFVAMGLAPSFKKVTGLDPSAKMVSIGLQPEDPKVPRITYTVGKSEDFGAAGLGNDSVDLVVAGQASHWFDHNKTWSELARVLRSGGTVAYVGYSEMFFPTFPTLTPLYTAFMQGKGGIGPYYSQPGRSIVEGLLDRIPFPVAPEHTTPATHPADLPPPDTETLLASIPDLDAATHTHPAPANVQEPAPVSGSSGWDPSTAVRIKQGSDGDQWRLTRKWNFEQLEGYFRSASALHTFHEKHPEDAARRGKGGKEGDIVERLIEDIKVGMKDEREKRAKKTGKPVEEGDFDVAWPLVLMMIKRT